MEWWFRYQKKMTSCIITTEKEFYCYRFPSYNVLKRSVVTKTFVERWLRMTLENVYYEHWSSKNVLMAKYLIALKQQLKWILCNLRTKDTTEHGPKKLKIYKAAGVDDIWPEDQYLKDRGNGIVVSPEFVTKFWPLKKSRDIGKMELCFHYQKHHVL